MISQGHLAKVRHYIELGSKEGATLLCGGLDAPQVADRVRKGNYVAPTVFADVRNDMTIAVEEIFGPVLCILPYDTEEQAIAMANDTVYGLSGYVQGEQEHAQKVARQLRTGMVHVNGAGSDQTMPFGGFKQSGNGREWGVEGIHEFLETKSVFGFATA